MADYEDDFGWDGGWTDAIDHGHALADLMLGNVHPYDRDDGYIPDPQFATRPEVWKGDQYADGPDNATDPVWRSRTSSRGGVGPIQSRSHGEVEKVDPVRGQMHRVQPRPAARSPKPIGVHTSRSKAEQRSLVARSLGLSTIDIERVRRIEKATQATQTGATPAARRSAAARTLGISAADLKQLRHALTGEAFIDVTRIALVVLGKGPPLTMKPLTSPSQPKPRVVRVSSATKSKKKAKVSPRRGTQSGRRKQEIAGPPSWRARHTSAALPPIPFCAGCEQPIRQNGRCGCSG